MHSQKLYTTAARVQDFVVDYHRRTQQTIGFPDALKQMRDRGLLSDEAGQTPAYFEIDSPESFNRFILSFPLEANGIIQDNERHKQLGVINEVALFPFEKDVFCFKHFPHMTEDPHSHDYFEMTYLYAGSCRLLIDGEVVPLEEGDLCIVPPRAAHNQPVDENSLAICVAVRASTFDAIFGNLLTQDDLISSFFRNSLYGDKAASFLRLKTQLEPSVKELLHQLVYESYVEDAYANSVCVSLVNLFLAQILRLYSDTASIHRAEQLKPSRADFPRILNYIQQNFRTVTLDGLSKAFHYSPSHLCRLISSNLNQSFTSVVRSLKLARAREYLQNESIRIQDVAFLSGYGSVDHFSREFKKAHGQAPAHWRETNRKQRRTEMKTPE